MYFEMWIMQQHLMSAIGTQFHILLNDLLTLHFDNLNIYYFSEPAVYPTTRPDGLLLKEDILDFFINREEFLALLNISLNNLQTIKVFVFDYTSDLSDYNIVSKIEKYQRNDIFLFIVGYHWTLSNQIKNLPNDSKILYPENIRVIDIDLFRNIFKFPDNLSKKLEYLLDLVDKNNLYTLTNEVRLEKQKLHKKEMLLKVLKSKGLIKFEISEYLNFKKKSSMLKFLIRNSKKLKNIINRKHR